MLLTDASKDLLKSLDIALPIGELEAVIGEHRVDLVGDGGHQVPEELRGDHLGGCCLPLGIGQLAGAVNRDKPGECAFFRADLGAIELAGADPDRPSTASSQASRRPCPVSG
jgi:hypothetical protein